MSDHDVFCPWLADPNRGPVHLCAWCDVIRKARADATIVADHMLTQAKALADESQEALAAAIQIIMQLRLDVAQTARELGMDDATIARITGGDSR